MDAMFARGTRSQHIYAVFFENSRAVLRDQGRLFERKANPVPFERCGYRVAAQTRRLRSVDRGKIPKVYTRTNALHRHRQSGSGLREEIARMRGYCNRPISPVTGTADGDASEERIHKNIACAVEWHGRTAVARA